VSLLSTSIGRCLTGDPLGFRFTGALSWLEDALAVASPLERIAAVALHPHIGQSYPAIVTGVNNYGTFVRTLDPHVDGKVVQGGKGLDVGDRVTVKLVSTDPERGFIDFAV